MIQAWARVDLLIVQGFKFQGLCFFLNSGFEGLGITKGVAPDLKSTKVCEGGLVI